MIKYAVITDEISQNIFEAAELAGRFNLAGIEIRSVNEHAPHQLTKEDIAQIKQAMEKYNLECCAISSPFFKCNCNKQEVEENIKILEKCILVAKELGTKYIRGFTFFKEKDFDEALPEIVAEYKKLKDILEENDIYILLESDPSVNASCGETLAKIIKAIDMDRVKGLWDPGNDIYSPECEVPYPNGYSFMKDLVYHVHIKDAVKNADGSVDGVAFGKGDVDFKGQLTALKNDGYNGWIVMETHYKKTAKISEDLLTRPQGSAFSAGGYESTEECLTNLMEMAKNIWS